MPEENTPLATFKNRLKKLLKNSPITQTDVADHCDVHPNAVGKWKAGEYLPETANLIKLAELFCVSLDYLLGLPVRVPPKVVLASAGKIRLLLSKGATKQDFIDAMNTAPDMFVISAGDDDLLDEWFFVESDDAHRDYAAILAKAEKKIAGHVEDWEDKHRA